MPFIFKRLEIPDLILIEPKVFSDNRGFFVETFKYSDFKANGINQKFVQDNHSLSSKGILRGLHYQQNPMAQGKLVRVVKGKVWDVMVDIRKTSPTYKTWVGIELSEKNHRMLYIPPGFAHGFVTLEEDTHFLYKCSNEYSPEYEAGIIWNDPEIGIDWPIQTPVISDRDQMLLSLKDAKIFD